MRRSLESCVQAWWNHSTQKTEAGGYPGQGQCVSTTLPENKNGERGRKGGRREGGREGEMRRREMLLHPSKNPCGVHTEGCLIVHT